MNTLSTPNLAAGSTTEPAHPMDRLLKSFAVNEMGPQRKKMVVRHLENCEECRTTVARHRELARRYRDLERSAIRAYSPAS
jgi:anti-sigma factor RsiW